MKMISIFLLVVASACGRGSDENTLLKPTDFQQKLVSLPGAVLLDVRSLEEVRQERIRGSINFDFNMAQFDILIAGLDKAKPYFVYCASGVRSARAAEKMRKGDFEKVYLLDGGMKAWKAAGLPTQTTTGN